MPYIYIYARLETKYIALSLAAVVWDNASWTIDACYRQYMAMHHPCLHQINTVFLQAISKFPNSLGSSREVGTLKVWNLDEFGHSLSPKISQHNTYVVR